MSRIMRMTANELPTSPRVRKYVGAPMAAAALKQISCLLVKFRMSRLFTLVKSLGTLT